MIKDTNGYYYIVYFSNLQKQENHNMYFVYYTNPYSIRNIKLWYKLNNKPFELISDKYEGATKKLKWKCLKDDCREIFEASWICIHRGDGCPFCASKQVGISNCLATKNPDVVKEWDYIKNKNLTPYNVTGNSNKKVWWICSKNHKHNWQATISDRNKYGCPFCAGRYATEENNLLVMSPDLCKEWNCSKNKKKPEEYCPSSGAKVWWICEKGHEWKAQIGSRYQKKCCCPYCSGLKPTKENNLLINNPKLCEEWNYKKNDKNPNEYTPNSGQKVWWKCKECGYEWKTTISSRNGIGKTGCPECGKSKGEIKIRELLKIKDVKYIPQKEFKGLLGTGGRNLSYDFYLPLYNLLIEYQGEQHEKFTKGLHKTKKDFEKQQEHDKRKREFAEINNIKLLEIWYWNFDNIEEILNNYLKNYNKYA